MRLKQVIILLVATVLPIGVFVFLKLFGRNEFGVEPLHQSGEMQVSSVCGDSYTTPYSVSENVLKGLQWSANDSLTLYVFDSVSLDMRDVKSRMAEAYQPQEVSMNRITSDSLQLGLCAFLIPADANAVMIDQKRRIRGYYKLPER